MLVPVRMFIYGGGKLIERRAWLTTVVVRVQAYDDLFSFRNMTAEVLDLCRVRTPAHCISDIFESEVR